MWLKYQSEKNPYHMHTVYLNKKKLLIKSELLILHKKQLVVQIYYSTVTRFLQHKLSIFGPCISIEIKLVLHIFFCTASSERPIYLRIKLNPVSVNSDQIFNFLRTLIAKICKHEMLCTHVYNTALNMHVQFWQALE